MRRATGSTRPCADVELVATTDVVESLRAVKDDEEREAIRQAQAITDAAFERILERFAIGVSEQQISRQLEALMMDEGAEGLAFDSIVAFGENAAEPHHEPSHRAARGGRHRSSSTSAPGSPGITPT